MTTFLAMCSMVISVTMSSNYPPYITQWQSYINTASREYCVDANLIAAVIWKESLGVGDVVAPLDGGIGLMQIMPSDNPIRPDLSIHWRPTTARLLDPYYNVSVGTSILREVLARTGDVLDTLGQYNCGEKNLRKDNCGSRGGYVYAFDIYKKLKKYGGAELLKCDEHHYLKAIVETGETVPSGCHYAPYEEKKFEETN